MTSFGETWNSAQCHRPPSHHRGTGGFAPPALCLSNAGKLLDKRLQELGGNRFYDLGRWRRPCVSACAAPEGGYLLVALDIVAA